MVLDWPYSHSASADVSMCSLAKIGHMVHSRDMVHMYTSGNNQLTSYVYMYKEKHSQPQETSIDLLLKSTKQGIEIIVVNHICVSI